ncbi:MAG: metallophosphoesterase family protein [Polyangiaceae bacterium]
MPRIALISDLHGNEIALNAVLDDIDRRGADQTVCLGDVATLGPRPIAVLERLQKLGCVCILGNHDEFMLEPSLVREYSKIPVLLDAVAWCQAQLPSDAVAFIRSFRRSFELPLDDKNRLFLFHGSPESNVVDLLATTPPEELDSLLAGHHAAVMAGGHTHIQMLRQHRGVLVVNPGSVGMPFKEYVAGGPPSVLPYAEYASVEAGGGSVTVQLHRVPLDKAALRGAALSVDNPICASLAQMYA